MPELLTYDDVAKLLRMTGRNVSNLVKAGRLAAVKLGPRSVRFDPADVRRFIEGCKTHECELK
jgi:excisionase family DNA binding protein